jgi:hypothetical protein
VLVVRRIAGDRSRRHKHYLMGSLVCHSGGGRMGYGHSRGKDGVYNYFFCLGPDSHRTGVMTIWRSRHPATISTLSVLTRMTHTWRPGLKSLTATV